MIGEKKTVPECLEIMLLKDLCFWKSLLSLVVLYMDWVVDSFFINIYESAVFPESEYSVALPDALALLGTLPVAKTADRVNAGAPVAGVRKGLRTHRRRLQVDPQYFLQQQSVLIGNLQVPN